MTKTMSWKWGLALALALGMAAPAGAQTRRESDHRYERSDDHRWETDDDHRWDQPDRDQDVWRDGREAGPRRRAERQRHERGNGPAFCRSGQGHPVFGWDWCRERGWDRSNDRYPVRWERRTWEDVIFGGPRHDRKRSLERADLGDILGRVILGRLDTRRRELGAAPSWLGRWTQTRSGRELWITAGGIPIARLVDTNGDRRVDTVWLAER